MNAVDPGEFRDAQRESWDDAAKGWKKWSDWLDGLDGYSIAVCERLVELAGVEPGSRVLDVACGYGEPALTAARKASPGGRVVATDISAEMLAYGRERAATAGLDNVEFIESDASALDFPADSFDAALSRWGIIFEPDGEAAAARVRGFLKPGSRMAISSWGAPDRVPMIARPMRTALERLDVPPPPQETPGPLSRPTPEAIGGLLEGGGFSDVEVEEVDLTFEWESPEEFSVYIQDIIAPIRKMVQAHPEDMQEEVWKAIADDVRDESDDGGTLRLVNQVLMAVGQA
ncbi:MAG TPA: methyltransferase domain-containing protein [Solirubrobacterales bacterium]|nr:methyltransferase domain-containing protein [Solirubrobacterales bacterium]